MKLKTITLIAAMTMACLWQLCAQNIFFFTPCINGLQVDINGGVYNSPTSLVWNWGDGQQAPGWFPQSHIYTLAGEYTITATAYYSGGATSSLSQTVQVGPGILSGNYSWTIIAGQGGSISYQASVASGVVSSGQSVNLQQASEVGGNLTANPNQGYSFSGWTASSDIWFNSGSASTPSVGAVVDGNSTITANFSETSPPTFTSTAMPTLNGTQENSITLVTSAYLSGSFPYLATPGSGAAQNMITVVGLVNNSGQWVGGTPQIVYNSTPSSGGSIGTASLSNLVVPSSSGTYQLYFQSFLTTSTSAAISSFEMSPPTTSGDLSGLVATVIVGNPPSFTPTAMATLNGIQENNITLAPEAYLSGSFPYSAADGGSAGQSMVTVVGLVNNSGQWVGGTPQVVYNGTPSSGGSSGTASWSNLVLPSSTGTYQLWFQTFLTTDTSASVNSFEESPPVISGDLSGIVATVVVGNPSSFFGGIDGQVLGNGSPIVNAQVKIENTMFTANTLNDGTFSFSGVPSGNGYVLNVSAAGYNSTQLTGINVPVNSIIDLGDISLTSVGGPYTLNDMLNVNPAITTVEQGGTAYRYYCVQNASGNPQGGISVSVTTSGGTTITQGDSSPYWPGTTAGTSDGDGHGTVRITIPSSYLNSSPQTIYLSIDGQVVNQFQAEVASCSYDQVWRQELQVGGNVPVPVAPVVSVGGNVSAESEIRQTIVSGTATGESIARIDSFEITGSVGEGFDVGASLQTSSDSLQFSGGASASAGLFWGPVLQTKYSFADPNSTDPSENAMKLYLDLGNLLTAGGSSVGDFGMAFYSYVEGSIEPSFLGANLQSVEGDLQLGGDIQGTLGSALFDGNGQQKSVPVGGTPFYGSLSASAAGIAGYEWRFGNCAESAPVIGLTGSLNVMGGLNIASQINQLLLQISPSSSSSFSPGFFLNSSYGGELLAKTWTQQGASNPYQLELSGELSLSDSESIPPILDDWQLYDLPGNPPNYPRELTEIWQVPLSGGAINYQRSIYAAEVGIGVGLDVDLATFGLSFNGDFNGEAERGADKVVQRGAIFGAQHYPTESYPAMSTSLFPSQTWPDLLLQWIQNAAPILDDVYYQTVTTVADDTETTLIQAGQATLNIGQGALNTGSQILSSFVPDISQISLAVPAGKPVPLGSPMGSGVAYLPPDGSSNYIYGIGGIYQFSSTNAFNGTATLAICYSNANITGLAPCQFQMYQLYTNGWQLAGGTVNTNSDTVTATITNLGIFAIAPPMPTGDLRLISSTNALPADGISTMTVVVTNLMLNSGNVATQQWLFTATATGVQILSPDCDTNLPGVQVVSTNGALTLQLQALPYGNVAQINLSSVAGNAYGSVTVNLIDTNPPATPANVVATAGQSRIWVSWAANTEPDLAGYRVYYSAGSAGPPWNGTAEIDGNPSPVFVTGTNCLLSGLAVGTNYFIAVSALDTSSNESSLSSAIEVTTEPTPPDPPTGVSVQFESTGNNVLEWALSDDDGYNDRDVTQYYIWRAILPGGTYTNIAQVSAGVGIYTEPSPTIALTQSLSYAVSAVTGSGSTSSLVVATVVPPSNVVSSNAMIVTPQVLANGNFQFGLQGLEGQTYVVQTSTNLVNWTSVYTNTGPFIFTDSNTANYSQRFYRVVMP
ncbi:MAG TPA: carboxypeptidase regulatory-like domain-containing protein [Candidatus Sulfotelmatobacter sp.]|nr:carboxypeptidase regulatory-like domain-containing protein [Candidatus Sulfotelmatobacter sp.]